MTRLLACWAAMLPDQRIPVDGSDLSVLAASGLRPAGAGLVARRPSWLLPARHPGFATPVGPPTVGTGQVSRLWERGGFEQLVAATRARNWWLGDSAVPSWLEGRVRATSWLPGLCREFVTHRMPGARVVATYLIGSYLWAEQPSSRIDAVVVSTSPDESAVLDHTMSLDLPDHLRYSVDGVPIDGVDLLVVSQAALRAPERLTGLVGDWHLPDGRPYPCDISRPTVARAVLRTLRSGLLVDGADVLGAEPDPAGLLAHAYYFVQEASVLLAWRDSAAKAANRLLEASLVLDQLTGSGNRSEQLRGLCAAVRSAPQDPELLRRLQGWHGDTRPAVLPALVERLVRVRQRLLEPLPVPELAEVLDRADTEEWPAWQQARAELEQWLVPPVPAAPALRARSARVRAHLTALGVPDPLVWLGEPLSLA